MVPVTVLTRSKLVSSQMYFCAGSWLPGQTQWARSLTRVPSAQSPGPPWAFLGQVMPISNSLRGSPCDVVPARNFGKTSTLPGSWESLNPTGRTCASAGIADVSATSATSATRPHGLVCMRVLLVIAAPPLDVLVRPHACGPDVLPPAVKSAPPVGRRDLTSFPRPGPAPAGPPSRRPGARPDGPAHKKAACAGGPLTTPVRIGRPAPLLSVLPAVCPPVRGTGQGPRPGAAGAHAPPRLAVQLSSKVREIHPYV